MIISFKAFRPDLTCTSGGNTFQYQLGKWNEETEANCVRNGFHSAGNPLDCMSYYPVWEEAVYYAVLCDGDMDEDGCDSKISCTKLKLLRKLDLREFLECSILYMVDYPYMKSNHKVQMGKGWPGGYQRICDCARKGALCICEERGFLYLPGKRKNGE